MMPGLANRLADAGVLGINKRNAEYTLKYNPRRLYPLVDDKLRTKELARAAGIAVTELYTVIEIQKQVRELHARVKERPDFVVKPARGSGGDGILVITGRYKNGYRKASGLLMTEEALELHVSDILGGIFSLGGEQDRAIVEYRVQFDPLFEAVTYQGVPDIRIIVFMGVPVMAMVRLPTRMSEGRANLHQGAIGAGIDMGSGITLTAVWRNEIVEEHPDTGEHVSGIKIPGWDRLLALASSCYELTGLGYQGVDIVLDRDKGPLILELNARPGLNIQIANHSGLLQRLKRVEENQDHFTDVESRVAFAKEHFRATS
ncbi:MAG: alpha-L-glutamate ligase-like protein [Desulfobacteraceae bacterium]|jgi:alpha-L-glutamate ligase-like protein